MPVRRASAADTHHPSIHPVAFVLVPLVRPAFDSRIKSHAGSLDADADGTLPSVPAFPRHQHTGSLSPRPYPPAAAAAMGDEGEGEGEGDRSAVRAEESVSGGVDVWSDAVSSHAPDHLLVMVHGILGRCARAPPSPPSPQPQHGSPLGS